MYIYNVQINAVITVCVACIGLSEADTDRKGVKLCD